MKTTAKEKLNALNQTLRVTEVEEFINTEGVTFHETKTSLTELQIDEVVDEINTTLVSYEGTITEKFQYILDLLQSTIPIPKTENGKRVIRYEHPVKGLKRETMVRTLLDTVKAMTIEEPIVITDPNTKK